MSRRLAHAAVIVVIAALSVSLGLAGPAVAKKDGKGGGSLKSRTFSAPDLNLPIADDPDGIGTSGAGILQTQLRVGKRMRGLKIDDVNVNLRVTHGDVSDLQVKITAPNGASLWLFVGHAGGPTLGAGAASCDAAFFTVDDESPLFTQADPGSFVAETDLGPPYAGSAQPPLKPLAVLDGGPIRGIWTLTAIDRDGPGGVGTLDCWQIRVKPRRSGTA